MNLVAEATPPVDESTNMSSTEQAIREFLLEEILIDLSVTEIGPEDSLVSQGLLDSMAILRVISSCEDTFDVAFPLEVTSDSFESVRTIAALVETQREQ